MGKFSGQKDFIPSMYEYSFVNENHFRYKFNTFIMFSNNVCRIKY